jgi:hypothetical protein
MRKQIVEVSELEFEGLKESKVHPQDPPAILVMKRKSIRQFPNGQRVALYHIEKLNKFITIPYDVKGDLITTTEETKKDTLKTILGCARNRG